MYKKSKFLTFIFSFVPGLGHMYLGLLRQGVELMAVFFLSIYLTDWLNTVIFMFVAPVIWFYSLADAMHKCSLDARPEDKDISLISWFNSESSWMKDKSKLLGYTLVVLGSVLIFERVALPVIDRFISWEIRNFVQTGAVALIFILGGIKLISGSKKQTKESRGEESI